MKILLINQFGPASGAPTGRILGELGAELEKRGHTVHLVVTNSVYGKPRRGLGRLLQEGLSHLLLFCRSFRHPKVDAVISLTSPACLAITAQLAARLHGAAHFHWIMDLYPEVGVRLGELKDGPLARFLARRMGRVYRNAARVVVLDEDMRDYVRQVYRVESVVIGPFPPEMAWPILPESPQRTRQWLYSGNFGRAHEIRVLLQVQKRLENRGIDAELILQGQGPQFLASQVEAQKLDLRRVRWRPPVPLEQLGKSLLEADILVVTRRANMKGLLLPSKLILARLSGKRILWIGDTDGKTAQELQSQGHGVFSHKVEEAIADWMEVSLPRTLSESTAPLRTQDSRHQSFEAWDKLLSCKGDLP